MPGFINRALAVLQTQHFSELSLVGVAVYAGTVAGDHF